MQGGWFSTTQTFSIRVVLTGLCPSSARWLEGRRTLIHPVLPRSTGLVEWRGQLYHALATAAQSYVVRSPRRGYFSRAMDQLSCRSSVLCRNSPPGRCLVAALACRTPCATREAWPAWLPLSTDENSLCPPVRQHHAQHRRGTAKRGCMAQSRATCRVHLPILARCRKRSGPVPLENAVADVPHTLAFLRHDKQACTAKSDRVLSFRWPGMAEHPSRRLFQACSRAASRLPMFDCPCHCLPRAYTAHAARCCAQAALLFVCLLLSPMKAMARHQLHRACS